MDGHPADGHHDHIGSGTPECVNVLRDEGPERRLPSIGIEIGDDEHTQRGAASAGLDVKSDTLPRGGGWVVRTNRSDGTYSNAVAPDSRPPSPLHSRAMTLFPHASIRGLTTFAPPGAAEMTDMLDGSAGVLVAINAEKIAHADPLIADLTARHLG